TVTDCNRKYQILLAKCNQLRLQFSLLFAMAALRITLNRLKTNVIEFTCIQQINSGSSARKGVEVQVLSSAPQSSEGDPPVAFSVPIVLLPTALPSPPRPRPAARNPASRPPSTRSAAPAARADSRTPAPAPHSRDRESSPP